MATQRQTIKKEIKHITRLLSYDDYLDTLKKYPEQSLISPLFSCLCSSEERVKWLAVSGFGQVVARLADNNMEKARIVIRRCMWMLNDESGGIGWGVPETLAEIMVCHDSLAKEYSHVFVSYMREEGFFLELEALQRGLMWGASRLADERPQLMKDKNAVQHLLPYLKSKDHIVSGLAAKALSTLGEDIACIGGRSNGTPVYYNFYNKGEFVNILL